MKSFQQRVLDEIEKAANDAGCDVMQHATYANVGMLYLTKQNPAFGGPIQTVVKISYDFQHKATILFNGAKHGPSGIDNYYFSPTDNERMNAAIDRVRTAINEAKVAAN